MSDKTTIEKMLINTRPNPSERLTNHMKQAPWQTETTHTPLDKRRQLMVASVATLLIASVFAFTPLGAIAQDFISQFFIIGDSNEQSFTVERPLEPTAIADAIVWDSQTLADAQAEANFTLMIPQVPTPYAYDGADVYNNGNTVMLTYRIMEGDPLGRNLVFIQMPVSEKETREIGADAVVQSLTINGNPAEYTQGFWRVVNQTIQGTSASGQQEVDVETIWDNDFGLHFLEWVDGDMAYQLMWQETYRPDAVGRTDAMGYLTLDDLIMIAETVR